MPISSVSDGDTLGDGRVQKSRRLESLKLTLSHVGVEFDSVRVVRMIADPILNLPPTFTAAKCTVQDGEARRLPNLVGAIARRSALLRDKLVPRHLDVLVFAAKGAINAVEAVTRAISVDALRVVPTQWCVFRHDLTG